MECAIAQLQSDEAWRKFWGSQPLPDDPAGHVLAETWTADASGSRILERLQEHAAIVERQIARALRMLRLEMPLRQKCDIEPISSAEPEPPGSDVPAPAPETAESDPIAEASSPRPAAWTRCLNTRRRAPRLKTFLEMRRNRRRAA
ncbi:MAG: hypothetical protein IPM24_14290 [Bryobacterales bacterium]|nr:hypothetical protein [Bryobacterales bacterium]